MIKATIFVILVAAAQVSSAQTLSVPKQKTIAQRVDSVLRLMTLEEKIGQLNQLSGTWAQTGPITGDDNKLQEVREGKLGSMLNINGVVHTREIQQMAM